MGPPRFDVGSWSLELVSTPFSGRLELTTWTAQKGGLKQLLERNRANARTRVDFASIELLALNFVVLRQMETVTVIGAGPVRAMVKILLAMRFRSKIPGTGSILAGITQDAIMPRLEDQLPDSILIEGWPQVT